MRGLASFGWLVFAAACTFDASGTPGGPMLGVGEEGEDAEDGEGERPAPSPGNATTTGADDDPSDPEDDEVDADDGTEGGDEDDDGDGSVDPEDGDDTSDHGDGSSGASCPTEVFEILWIDDASIEAPMSLATVSGAAGDPSIAVSTVAGAGKATFTLSLPCAGDYFVWGLVWDQKPGAWADPDPDSFFVGTGGDEVVWRYGCQTFGASDLLTWQKLERLDAQPCNTSGLALSALGPGQYALSFRNREAGSGSAVAGIAALVIATDPDADPYDLYTP